MLCLVFFFKKDVEYTFNCQLLKFNLEYKISCGVVSEDITEEDYKSIINDWINNRIKFELELSTDIINERLKKYQ